MQKTRCETVNGESLLLQGVKARGRVVGRMLDMTLAQRYLNRETKNVEVVYTFPLPWEAVLMGLEVEIHGETLKGMVKAKSTARVQYEEALSEGDSGILVEVNPDRSYTLEVGNLMPGESCVIRLQYAQILQPEQGSLRLMVPTTLAPRYGDPIKDAGYAPHAVPETDASVEYPLDIQLSVQGELVRASIGSPSHKVAIQHLPAVGMPENQVTHIRLASEACLDRDFVVVFDELAHASLGLAAWDRLDPGLGVVMANFTPELPTRQSLPVTMKVLVDCSGSMNGDSIQAARSALHDILAGLQPLDRFSLSRFGSTVEHRSKALWKTGTASMAAARRWVERLEANLGGTKMNNAILSTLALPGADRCDVLLITDGDIHEIEAVIDSAQQSKHRFFVVGIGTAVSEGLLRRLVRDTGGSCEFVAPGEAVGPAISRIFYRMRSPAVHRTRVEWPAQCVVHAESELPLCVFGGDDVTVFARLHAAQSEALLQPVRLWGQLEGVAGEVCLAELQPAFMADEGNTLARLAASQRYWQLCKMAENAPAVLTSQLPALAEKYQLVTQDTSLILIKVRADGHKATDMPELRKVRGMLPAGFGGFGGVTQPTLKGALVPSVWRGRGGIDHVSFSRIQPVSAVRIMASHLIGGTGKGISYHKLSAFLGAFLGQDSADKTSLQQWVSPPASDVLWSTAVDGPDDGTAHYQGLTPAGLTQGLKINATGCWPSRYADLEAIGLGGRVVEWLELVVGDGEDEQTVVRVFLQVMRQFEFGTWSAVERLLGRWRADEQDALTKVEEALRQRILSNLSGVHAEHWPTAVLDYAEDAAWRTMA